MSHTLTAAEARSVATALWGKINTTYKTNTKNAYCFSCEGHGGFIVAKQSIPQDKIDFVNKYIQPYSGDRHTDNRGKTCFMHHARIRNGRRGHWVAQDTIEYYVFEEDSDYSIAVLAGINLKKDPISQETAQNTFYNWYDETNPKVINRKLVEEKRINGDPDLIISASGSWKTNIEGVCEVITADGKKHLVKGYDKCRDEFNEPYLSGCEIYEPN